MLIVFCVAVSMLLPLVELVPFILLTVSPYLRAMVLDLR